MFIRHFLGDLGNVAEWSGFVLTILFFIQYTMLAKWWKNPVGQTIVALDFCVWLLLFFSCMNLAWPHLDFYGSLWYAWILVLDVAAIPVIAAWRMIIWEKMRRARKRNNKGALNRLKDLSARDEK